ncbi:hypothetical protein ANN_02134 [Periplaneta americana]|uniref:Uncharacterized protein n=1 Tax=Periplaneta americana TaxID=6978 RepID=A0ABQ8TZM0_PERAM|nr:hypothetical protein ANN_02134 [Periplaneta americana]
MAGLCQGGNEPPGFLKAKKDGACEMDRQNKKCTCVGNSGRRKNDVETDQKEEKELAGSLVEKKLSSEGCTGRNGEREKISRQKEISDDRRH